MKVFVSMKERECHDPQEIGAMIQHRLKAMEYQKKLLADGHLQYVFYTVDLNKVIMMYEVETLSKLDWHIKRDPYFPYTFNEVVPIIDFESFMNEAQDLIEEEIFTNDDLKGLMCYESTADLDPDGTYWLTWKTLLPFSPLLSEEEQSEIHRKNSVSAKPSFSRRSGSL